MGENGEPLRCHAPDCPCRELRGDERRDDGHATVEGKPWHFGCWFRRQQQAVHAARSKAA